MARRSIGVPLTIGIVLMLLVLTLAVGWQVLIWSEPLRADRGEAPVDTVLLVLGTLFFAVVMIGLVWLCTWLVAEVRLNQRQRAFLDAVTHEMKTPLASFRLGLDTLGRHELPAERRREFVDRMGEDLDRLDETIRLVLAAARADEGSRRNQPSAKVELRDVLRETIDELCERHHLPDGSVRLSKDVDVMPRVRGDAVELGLIFKNLLENAVKYSPEAVDVEVQVRSTGDGRVQVEIVDQGMGIPPWELRRIFHRFYRASRDVQRQVAGLGLGLFVVRNLVRRQGGRVVARSDGAGRGSRFVVTLRAA